MPLVKMKEILTDAKENGYGVGAFSVANLEMIMGAVRAAEELRSPLILQIAEVRLKHSLLPLGMRMECIRENPSCALTVNKRLIVK